MNDPIIDEDRPRVGLWIALGLVGCGLIAAWALVWFVSSGHFKLKPPRPEPPRVEPPHVVPPSVVPAPAQPAPTPVKTADGHMVTHPDWRRKPTGGDIARYYPERAQRLNQGGNAVISCLVARDGKLVNCRIASETPAGWDFGQAAVRMSAEFRMWPATLDGKPVDSGQVNIPIVFSPPETLN